MSHDDLEPGMDPDEAAALAAVRDRLERAHPTSTPRFKRELGRSVRTEAARRHLRHRPTWLWLRISALVAIGVLLLLLAASQS